MSKLHNDVRAEQILELVVCGLTRAQVIKWVEEKSTWGIKTRQIDRLIAKARELLEKEAAPHRQRELARAIRRLDMLFARSVQINDFKTALSVEKERIALLKLGEKPRHGPAPQPAAVLNLRGSWRAKQATAREAERN